MYNRFIVTPLTFCQSLTIYDLCSERVELGVNCESSQNVERQLTIIQHLDQLFSLMFFVLWQVLVGGCGAVAVGVS